MDPYFTPIYSELETQREELLASVKDVTIEKWQHSPQPGKWSIGQILTHLVTSEQLSLGYMKKKSQGINQAKNSGVWHSIKLGILIVSQRIPFKYKAPKVVVERTPPIMSLEEISQKWDSVRDDLKKLLEEINGRNKKKLIYKHPIAGRLDAAQAMTFLREHIIHHWPQIKRLL